MKSSSKSKALLAGKLAVITGAGSGIGRASALLFAQEGAKIVVADFVAMAGEETARLVRDGGGEAIFVRCDVSNEADVRHLMEEAIGKFGRVDILFNNAGINLEKTVEETTVDEFDRVLGVNLKGVFLCSKYALPNMIQNKGGVIVNTASVAGVSGNVHLAAYSASKAGVILLTKCMALDYGPNNIRVNCICPSGVLTPMHEAFLATLSEKEKLETTRGVPLGRHADPEEIARVALFLASDDASYISGAEIHVTGGRG